MLIEYLLFKKVEIFVKITMLIVTVVMQEQFCYKQNCVGRFPSGQRGRTVNPLAQPSQVRILFSPPFITFCLVWCLLFVVSGAHKDGCKDRDVIAGIAQLARATAFQAVGCGFDSRFPLHLIYRVDAGIAQLVEQLICNQQVAGSSPVASSIKLCLFCY